MTRHAACQRCGKPGRPEQWNGRVRTLAPCFVCGYGAADNSHTPTPGERAEQRLRKAGYRSGDLFAHLQHHSTP